MTALQSDIEERLAQARPDVEVLLAEVLGGGTVRVFIDHPDGVTLALCEQVSEALGELRDRYALEISSPGTERPLSKPDHFRRFIGRRARVRVRNGGEAFGGRDIARRRRPAPGRPGAQDRRRSFTGELVGVSDSGITLAAEEGLVAIPYSEIRRSNLVEE